MMRCFRCPYYVQYLLSSCGCSGGIMARNVGGCNCCRCRNRCGCGNDRSNGCGC